MSGAWAQRNLDLLAIGLVFRSLQAKVEWAAKEVACPGHANLVSSRWQDNAQMNGHDTLPTPTIPNAYQCAANPANKLLGHYWFPALVFQTGH